jgi:Na+/H+ antiporter NhaD/arsenite permease-like protein
MKRVGRWSGLLAVLATLPLFIVPAAAVETAPRIDLTRHPIGYLALVIFFVAYGFVAIEEVIQLRKSKPVVMAAGLIWMLLGIIYTMHGQSPALEAAAKHVILDYAELMLFLIVAITYVNTMQERRVFEALRSRFVSLKLSYRQLFWLVGGLAFIFGPIIDNLTTALVMGAVVVAVGVGNYQFIVMGCIIIVVAANAGGVFSPFGDITSLMVWQKGKLEFLEFFYLFLPALVNFLVPAALMHFRVPKGIPKAATEVRKLKPGAAVVIWLFLATIATAVSFKSFFHLPPALGMMLGLGYLQMYSYRLQRVSRRRNDQDLWFDSFREIRRVEWDTLLFFRHHLRRRRPWRYGLSRALIELALCP